MDDYKTVNHTSQTLALDFANTRAETCCRDLPTVAAPRPTCRPACLACLCADLSNCADLSTEGGKRRVVYKTSLPRKLYQSEKPTIVHEEWADPHYQKIDVVSTYIEHV